MVAADEVGVLALPAEPGGFGERLFHHRRGVDEHLEIAPRFGREPAAERLQLALDDIVIVAPLRIDRDAPDIALPGQRERIGCGRVAHAESDNARDLRPERCRAFAMMRARLHPDHVAMLPLGEPLAQSFGGARRGVGARDPARREAQFGGLCLDPVFQLVFAHRVPLPQPSVA